MGRLTLLCLKAEECQAAASGRGDPKRVRISQGVAAALVVDKVQPAYPPDTREQQIQGNVLLHVIIGKEGNVDNVQLITGHPLLASAAINAVRQWRLFAKWGSSRGRHASVGEF